LKFNVFTHPILLSMILLCNY